MNEKLDLFTGTLDYKNIRFTFVFDRKELRLIPPEHRKDYIEYTWIRKEIEPGAYTFAEPAYVEDDYLIGKCYETGCNIVFLPDKGKSLGFYNAVIRISLRAYVLCRYDRECFDKMTFTGPEINYIHPAKQGMSLNIAGDEAINRGTISVTTEDYSHTKTQPQHFKVDGKDLSVHFDVFRTVSTRNDDAALVLKSALVFEFEQTDDYLVAERLWKIALKFIGFLCYRENIQFTSIELSAPYPGGKHERYAEFHVFDECTPEPELLRDGRCICQSLIAGYEGKILEDIAEDTLYLRHIPETYRAGKIINASRFVMITTAFEWEFRRLYPEGIEKSASTLKAEMTAEAELRGLEETAGGKLKRIYRHLSELVSSNPLSAEINHAARDLDPVIGVFGKHLYAVNGHELKYGEMGNRLGTQETILLMAILIKNLTSWIFWILCIWNT